VEKQDLFLREVLQIQDGEKEVDIKMAVLIASATTFSVGANAKSADQVSGQYQHVGRGKFTLIAFSSATGLNATCSIGGINLVNDLPIPFFGTTGSMDTSAHVIVSQVMNGGRVELFFRNTTAGALTTDYQLLFEPL